MAIGRASCPPTRVDVWTCGSVDVLRCTQRKALINTSTRPHVHTSTRGGGRAPAHTAAPRFRPPDPHVTTRTPSKEVAHAQADHQPAIHGAAERLFVCGQEARHAGVHLRSGRHHRGGAPAW